jgi:hypothetical protein
MQIYGRSKEVGKENMLKLREQAEQRSMDWSTYKHGDIRITGLDY